MAARKEPRWYVYILQCLDGSLYTGMTNDLGARMRLHRLGRGSKYVRSRGFRILMAFRSFSDRSSALKEEARVKRLSRGQKLVWCLSTTWVTSLVTTWVPESG
jgi:putative endonuclease